MEDGRDFSGEGGPARSLAERLTAFARVSLPPFGLILNLEDSRTPYHLVSHCRSLTG
jgi:hypothetical protein